ncbi:MAG: hypothetical protein R3360_03140, partial [Alphaproteobacteria bacterium]|nr:hypothetical protein [Alphaproteobacteria bacterium]
IVVFARDPALGDVLWNIAGLLLGVAAASLPTVRHAAERVDVSPWLSPPVLIILSWLLVFAVPFVPAISPSEIWYSIKPLWEVRGWRLEPLLTSAAVWLAVGLLLQDVLGNRRVAVSLALMALLGLSLLLPAVVAENALERGYVLGGLAGTALWILLSYVLRLPAVWLNGLAVGLLIAVLIYRGLTPLEARPVTGRFLWLPFAGALIGPLLQNIRAMLIKLTIYGAMLWLTRGQGRFTLLVWGALLALVSAIEVAQLYLWSGVPESTDPLLVVLIAIGIALWERRKSQRAAEKKGDSAH